MTDPAPWRIPLRLCGLLGLRDVPEVALAWLSHETCVFGSYQ